MPSIICAQFHWGGRRIKKEGHVDLGLKRHVRFGPDTDAFTDGDQRNVDMKKQVAKSEASRPNHREIRVDRQRYGTVVVEAEFETVDGVESPEPSRVQFFDDERIVEVAGRNALALAHIMAIAMSRNQILD